MHNMATMKDIPAGLMELLSDFTMAVLNEKPPNLRCFAAEYFAKLVTNDDAQLQPRSESIPMYIVVDDEDANEIVATPSKTTKNKKKSNKFQRRLSVCGESYNPEEDNDADDNVVYPKTDKQRNELTTAVGSILLFRCLDDDQMRAVIDAMFEKKVVNGEVIIQQDDDGDYFYVIEQGRYNVSQRQADGEMKIVHQFVDKGCFGELALMYNMPRLVGVRFVHGLFTSLSASLYVLWLLFFL